MPVPENVEELRAVKRFIVDPPIRGSFANQDVSIADFGERGVQAEHASPLKLGLISKLSFNLPMTNEVVKIEGRVVWSRLSKKPNSQGKYLYRSGLRVDGDEEVMKATLNRMISFCIVQADTNSLEKKKKALWEKARARAAAPTLKPIVTRAPEIPYDQILIIQQARARLQAHPDEAVKWYNRAKFTQTNAPDNLKHHREEVLAVWEYLERTIEIGLIARVFDQHK